MWAGTKKVYVNIQDHTGYKESGKNIEVHYWGGSSDNYAIANETSTSNLFCAEVPDDATHLQVCRADANNRSNRYNYQYETSNTSHNVYNVTGWDNSGSWYAMKFIPQGKYIYYQYNSNSNWTQADYNVKYNWKCNSSSLLIKADIVAHTTKITDDGNKYIYCAVPSYDYVGTLQFLRLNPSDNNQWNWANDVAYDGTSNCMYFTSASWDGGSPSWKTYSPPLSAISISDNGTTNYGGNGSSDNPYLVKVGDNIKVSASATKAINDPDANIYYQFYNSSSTMGSETTTSTYSTTAGSVNTVYTMTVKGRTKIGSTWGTQKSASSSKYYKRVNVYHVTYAAGSYTESGSAPSDATHYVYYTGNTPTPTIKDNTGSLYRAGYNFNGWNTAEDGGGTDYAVGATPTLSGDLTLYPKWTPASTATLTYHANYISGSGSGTGSVPSAQIVTLNSSATVANKNTLAFVNYTFQGWNTDEHITGTSYAVGSSITMNENKDLYAVWTRSIPLDDQDATTAVTGAVYGTYNSTYLPSFTNPAKTGYDFQGWYTQIGGGGNFVINTSGVFQADKNHWTNASCQFIRPSTSTSSLYAKWTQTVTLKANTDNHGSGTDKTATATWNKGTVSIGTHCSPATGYQLDGYYTAATGGTKILNANGSFAGEDITNYITSGKWTKAGATTLWAQYTPKSYTITFAPNGGSVTPTSRSVTYDAEIANAPIPTKTGYNFTGYNTEGGASITTNTGVFKSGVSTFTDGSAHWIKDANATITAQWTEKKVSIAPTVNSIGTEQGYTASASVGSIGIETSTVLTADAPGEGYRFSGWTLSGNLVITSGTSSDRSITVRTNGDGNAVTATANYAVDTYIRLYFQNTGNWGTIDAYVWYDGHDKEEGGKNAAWPGVNINSQTETICGVTYHYYEFDRSLNPNWDKVIFNCGSDACKTSNLDIAGHNRLFYKFSDSKWYVPTNTFYFVNSEFWDDVYVYCWKDAGDYGYGEWPGTAMEKVGTVMIDGHEYDYYGVAGGVCSYSDGNYIVNNGKSSSSPDKKQTSDLTTINNYYGQYFVPDECFGANASVKPDGAWYDADGVHSATIGCPALLPFADISSISLSATRVPPMAEITATPNMNHKRAVDQAYCWAVYSDEECTSPVNVSFTSLGSGRVQFTVPQTIGTYYLKLTVRASAACNASIDDEEVQSFNVTTDNMVFFNNSATQWSGVYVYFLGDTKYWSDENKGSGCKDRDYGRANQMHRIGKSDIYFYEYSGNALGVNAVQFIAFTEYGKPDATDFAYTNAAYRGDFARGCAPMYVPENWVTDRLNYCEYYNRGYWTTYGVNGVARNSGFTLKVFDAYNEGSQVASETLSNTDGSNTYRATVNLSNSNWQYGYQLLSCGNKYYGNDGAMTAHNSSNWKFEPDKRRCGLDSKAVGAYTFIVQCTDGGEVRVSVEYPLMDGDYRLLYNDTCVYQAHAHPSQFIRQNYSAENVKLDTVSMYIRPDKQPVLTIQRCTNASSAPPTWEIVGTYDVTGLTNGHGVYNFYISHAVSSGALTINGVSPYTGLYYIRTQQADGGWTGYKTNSDNVMTYTEYAEQKNYGFNYYMTKWIGATGADVTFTIACDYSESLCDTMVADPGNNPLDASQARSIPHSASVRFGWNSKTNTLHRAYINGTSIVSDRYLVMIGDEKLKDSEGEPLAISGLNPNEIGFTDLNNWIYRCDVKAVTGAEVQLVGNYDGHTQHFIGTAEKPEEIIGGDSGEQYLMRVTYDFKTNRLMTAWLPDGDAITSNMTLNADMMLIREGQNAATQVYFGEGKKDRTIDEIHSIYGVMEFQYSKFANQFPNWSAAHAYEYLMYYISFPFDVKVSEIFGAGVRGKNWIIQKYNGAKRAKIGWFADTSTFWETLPGDSTLHAHEGYLLLLDRISFNDPGSNVWTNRPEKVYLYFPSISTTIGTISDKDKSIEVPSHVCGIDRSFTVDGVDGELNHRNTDSHWNVIGTPLFETKNAASIAVPEADGDGEKTLQYYYAWDCADNTLSARSALTTSTEFKSMHGYMVQYAGTVTFHGASIGAVPASVAARHMPSDEKNYRIELQLINENGKTNRTYVELRENACDTFALNEDMYMMRSSRTVDLYSFAGAYDVAANVLSVNNHIVPVGTDVKVAGTYRFTMPSEFSGTVTLIDTETGTRTNLAFGDYEVNLPKGTSNNRFLLEININKMPTAIDGVDGGSLKDGKAHKFIENGQMYILQNGIIYDAQGKRVK